MAQCQTSGVRLRGLASAVPAACVPGADPEKFGAEEAAKLQNNFGVRQRHVAPAGMCTSDLCFAAATRILEELNWSPESIDGLIFVSQTPDYVLPATSCVLHARLKLSKHCAAFDVNLGCSGYVYGLWIASQMLSTGSLRRILLLVGETSSRLVAASDRSSAPLFGDAGTATALESDPEAPSLTFQLGTDGGGWPHLQVPAGGFRRPLQPVDVTLGPGMRGDQHLLMNGAEIFAFSLREVPPLIERTLADAHWSLGDLDHVVLHQANQMMLVHLAKKLRIPEEKFVLAMSDFGNTSSASIPLAVTDQLAESLATGQRKCLFVGFGVGFSWGAMTLTCGPMSVPPLILLDAPAETECLRGVG